MSDPRPYSGGARGAAGGARGRHRERCEVCGNRLPSDRTGDAGRCDHCPLPTHVGMTHRKALTYGVPRAVPRTRGDDTSNDIDTVDSLHTQGRHTADTVRLGLGMPTRNAELHPAAAAAAKEICP